MKPHRGFLLVAMVVAVACGDTLRAQPDDGPLSPAQAIKAFVVEEGVRVELVASEPVVVDPVALAFDERGRMYVAENRGYPKGPPPGEPQVGVVALLEDEDGDGAYEKRTDFATGLSFPNGLTCWDGGVIVTCSPDILYLKDTDGDGRADVRKTVLTGFSTAQSTQLRASHPTLGPDGWIYVTSGLVGGKISSPLHPQHPPVEANSDFRFKPDGSAVQPVGGKGQFGLSFDDFGHRFVCTNRQPAQHVVLMPRHLQRNPHLPMSDPVENVAAGEEKGKVYPLTADTTTASYIPSLSRTPHAGTFTSACGLVVFRGSGLGGGHDGNIIICEPAQNLVQRQVLQNRGASFVSHRPYEGKEFLASTDRWFRPVFAANGPDGSLYICDMYRKVLDHPDYLPKEVHAEMDFNAGNDKGRVYRLVRGNNEKRIPMTEILPADTAKLCGLLGDSSGWVSDTAHRLLLERRDPAAVSLIREIVRSGSSEAAVAAAVWTLDAFAVLDDGTLDASLRHRSPAIRELAVRVIEERLSAEPSTQTPRWLPKLIASAADSDSRVRFHVALALASINDAATLAPLAEIAARGLDDRWTRAAVLGGISHDPRGFVAALYRLCKDSPGSLTEIGYELGRVFGSTPSSEQSLGYFLDVTQDELIGTPPSNAALAGLVAGLRSRGMGSATRPPLYALLESSAADAPVAKQRLEKLSGMLSATVADATVPIPSRTVAVELLGEVHTASALAQLESLLAPGQPVEIQLAAVRSLGRFADPAAGAILLAPVHWSRYAPSVREAVITGLMSNPHQLPALLDAMEKGGLPTWALDSSRRSLLMSHGDAAIKSRAIALFQNAKVTDRRKVYEEHKAVLKMNASGQRGLGVFQKLCISCHTHGKQGFRVGPDLTGVRNQPAEALLLHIVIPEHEIYPEFTQYLVQSGDGRTLVGIIASESATSVTLRIAGGVEETFQRTNITNLTALELSLMPQELEKTMTRQELADLIAFLKGQP